MFERTLPTDGRRRLFDAIEALQARHAHDFIMALPDGYDTSIGERGCNTLWRSAQRICLARALIKQPSILILDEPTSAVEPGIGVDDSQMRSTGFKRARPYS